ncbi:hypothetical protein QBZ16_000578 [Prototheca wickerhamii]|uniref:Uncharacterized protein n=1 Tax=Prototheca wickerhamii TaxID=3111 RepID=A0AAD9INL3_PROWI|nr:hypothetical protein QBZ16_000578 [Prototheca wickerhamii]
MKRFQDTGMTQEQAEKLTMHFTQLLCQDRDKLADLCFWSTRVGFTGFRTELLKSQELQAATFNRDTERLRDGLDKIRSEIRYEVDKLTASQRLDLNLEKGRIRDELQSLRDMATEMEIKVDKEVNSLKAAMEQSKNDTVKYRREEGAVEINMSVRDMDTLKHRISEAKSGTGQVAAVLASVTFKPRAAAFTSLIQSASRSKDAQKALEIFQCMQDMFHISPNTFSSSALISALAKSGQWQLAERYFHELESQATNDPQSRPNTVTYSALLTAYEKGGQFEKALKTFQHQLDAKVDPDLITFSSLVSACVRAGQLETAIGMLEVEPSVLTLNMMLQQACRLGSQQDVEDVLQVMKHTKTELSAESVAALARSTATHTRS